MSGAIQKECFICPGHLLAWRELIFCLSLASADLIKVGRKCGPPPLCVRLT